jgi:hypothetical protein
VLPPFVVDNFQTAQSARAPIDEHVARLADQVVDVFERNFER